MVLEEGVLEGRKVFCKHYQVRPDGRKLEFRKHVQCSEECILPYVPMLPIQILPQLAVRFLTGSDSTDNVDPEQIDRPRPWSMNEITRFILYIGPISSIFDYTTYFVML